MIFVGLTGVSHSLTRLYDPERLNFYDESQDVRCSGSLVEVQVGEQTVLDKCGEPIRRAAIRGRGVQAWIYWFGQYVYYLVMVDGQLERIVSTKCWTDNPDCE